MRHLEIVRKAIDNSMRILPREKVLVQKKNNYIVIKQGGVWVVWGVESYLYFKGKNKSKVFVL